MQAGWYIINYHNIDYEDSILTRALGGTTRPDVFIEHLTALDRLGSFISIAEGQALLDRGANIDEPLFSLWFDDGFRGVREFALPICNDFGIPAATSICSRFAARQELFWRCKLSYLAHVDGIRLLRSRLRKQHHDVPLRLRTWTVQNFTLDLLAIIDEVWEELSTPAFRRDAFRILDTVDGIAELAAAGWTVANHGAAHYALSPQLGWEIVASEFDECEDLVRRYRPDRRYWVIPFGTGSEHYLDELMRHATVVEVGERKNTAASWRETGRLFRHSAPSCRDIRAVLA